MNVCHTCFKFGGLDPPSTNFEFIRLWDVRTKPDVGLYCDGDEHIAVHKTCSFLNMFKE